MLLLSLPQLCLDQEVSQGLEVTILSSLCLPTTHYLQTTFAFSAASDKPWPLSLTLVPPASPTP